MMTSSDSGHAVAGGLARHIPVLVRPAVEFLDVRAGGVYVDATFGAGGYTRAILAAANCSVVAHRPRPERDRARRRSRASGAGGRLVLVEDTFSNLQAVARSCGYDAVDGVVFDLGVSSMQLDEAERGFSFRHDGPLDMRMGRAGPTAADVVALGLRARSCGHHRDPRRRAPRARRRPRHRRRPRAMRRSAPRARSPTSSHASCTRGRAPSTRRPARSRRCASSSTRSLPNWPRDLVAAEQVLKPGGRLVVVTFHSLEDRIVKSFLAERSRRSGPSRHRPDVAQAAATFRVLTKRPIVPDEAEISANPRARSAKLRAAERTDAPIDTRASPGVLPRVPSMSEVIGRQASGRPR